MWSRIHLIPLLQAEEDRDLVRRHLADQAREKELLGENIKVYNSDRYGLLSLFSLLPYPLTWLFGTRLFGWWLFGTFHRYRVDHHQHHHDAHIPTTR